MSKTIKIACEGAAMVDYKTISPFQGDLKKLPKKNYEALKESILKDEFNEPITVWKGKDKIGNGHQRYIVLKQMVEEEGYTLKDNLVPVNYVTARTKKQFARKVLGLAGNYGVHDEKGLLAYVKEWGITSEELAETYRLAGIDNIKFIEKFKLAEVDMSGLDLGDKSEVQVANPDELPPIDVPTSQVRMVQLFFDIPTANKFSDMIEYLKSYYKTSNLTDTVLNAVKETYEQHFKETPVKKAKVKGKLVSKKAGSKSL